jgi:hypothetical protein
MPNPDHIEALRRERAQRLLLLKLALPMLIPVDAADPAQCRLWQACELCIYLDHRVPSRRTRAGSTEQDLRRLGQTRARALRAAR